MDIQDDIFEQVTCFKCPSCSFYHEDKKFVIEHFSESHKIIKDNETVEELSEDSQSSGQDLPSSHNINPESNQFFPENETISATEDLATGNEISRKSIKCGNTGCGMKFASSRIADYHRNCHSGEKNFVCPECRTFSCLQWRQMSLHLWKEHFVDMELYSCDLCNYKTYSRSELDNFHRKTHEDQRNFLCDTCGKDFKNIKQLRNHKEFHNKSNTKAFVCELCDRKTFSTRRLLKQHTAAVHLKLKEYLCSFCGYKTSSQSTLKTHSRRHTGEKPFQCEKCEYQTADHNSFRRHRMRHSGERRYQCPHCNYASIQSSTYKAHLRNKHPSSATETVFNCKLCAFRTIRKEMLDQHVKTTHHSPKPTTEIYI